MSYYYVTIVQWYYTDMSTTRVIDIRFQGDSQLMSNAFVRSVLLPFDIAQYYGLGDIAHKCCYFNQIGWCVAAVMRVSPPKCVIMKHRSKLDRVRKSFVRRKEISSTDRAVTARLASSSAKFRSLSVADELWKFSTSAFFPGKSWSIFESFVYKCPIVTILD